MTTESQQRKNRLALADMLEHRITNKQFCMLSFTNKCGTIGCALGIAVLSGEFGYGWSPINGGEPVKDGETVSWWTVGPRLFGQEAYKYVMLNMAKRSRKTVAAELRAIK